MHRRVVSGVSGVLFTLVAVVAGIVVELQDRYNPLELGARSAVTLDFSASELTPEEAFRELGMLSDRLGLGLVKVAPDLGGDQSGEVFVVLGARGHFPDTVRRFGNQPDARVEGSAVLAHSYASGRYLVTGDTTHLAEFKTWLATHRIGSQWTDDSLGTTLELLVRQSDFGASLLATAALLVSLVLYWLAVKARARALRVLAGVSAWRIQYEDLGGFLVAMAAAAVVCATVAMASVGLTQGWVFVPFYARVLLMFDAAVILTTMVGAVALAVASWPTVRMLAAREPAVKSLHTVSIVLKASTFVLVLAAVAPAYTAFRDARAIAAEQAKWKSLADQVVLSFPGVTGEQGFQELMPQVGDVVRDAETRNAVALSYTWTNEYPQVFDLGPYHAFSLVNQRWLDLMLGMDRDAAPRGSQPVPGLIPLPAEQVPEDTRRFLDAHLELWSRQQLTSAEALSRISFYRLSGPGSLPLMRFGDLTFTDNAIVAVVPSLYEMFDDSFLASAATSRNLVFTGLGPTQSLLAQHGLSPRVQAKYVAEEGILRAQLTAYFAWLRAGSLVALIVALFVATLVSAFITAVVRARRDFPMRLAGTPWPEILSDRVAREWVVGMALAVLVLLFQGFNDGVLVAAVAVAALLISPLTHLIASRWAFANVSRRQL